MFHVAPKSNRNKLLGITYMLFGVTSYASVAIIVKVALKQNVDVFTLLAYRFLFAAIIQWGYYVLTSKAETIPLKSISRVVIVGIIGHAWTSILYFSSLELISTILATLIFATYPAWTMIFEKFLHGVPFTSGRILGLIAIFVGTVFLIVRPGEVFTVEMNLGIVLGLGNAIFLALYLVLSRSQVSQYKTEVLSPYYATSALVFFLVIKPPWTLNLLEFPQIGLIAALHFAFFGGFLGVILFLKALTKLDASETALLGGLEPVLTVVLAYIILKEELYGLQWLSMILIIVGVVVSQIRTRLMVFGKSI